MLNKRSGSCPSSGCQVGKVTSAGWSESWNDEVVEQIVDGLLLRSIQDGTECLRCFFFERHDSVCDAIAVSVALKFLRSLRLAPDSKVLESFKTRSR